MASIRVHLITLGVSNLERSRAFYTQFLGYGPSNGTQAPIAFFDLPGTKLSLYPRDLLAEDAQLRPEGTGFSGLTLAFNVDKRSEVSVILGRAVDSGAELQKPAQDAFWGGHSGYFADPDGNLWEVAWNPHFGFQPDGSLDISKKQT